jgi:hypothetical protein
VGMSGQGNRRAKRLYSLAYNRASAELRARHPEEFAALVREKKFDIVLEQELTGEYKVDGQEQARTHWPSEDDPEVCAECGKQVPCRAMRRRE